MLAFYLSLIEAEEDKAKISLIHEKYLDWMLKVAFHYLKDENDAEDAVSNVFLSIISNNCNIPTDVEEETKSYLFICTRNSALKFKKVKDKNDVANIEELFNLSSALNTEDEAIANDTFNNVLSYIDSLPSIYKDILTLHILFELDLKEIASVLSISLKTAETRLRRAKGLLKERFGDIEI